MRFHQSLLYVALATTAIQAQDTSTPQTPPALREASNMSFGIMGGYNALEGLGIVGSTVLKSRWAIDYGVGLGGAGLHIGAGARYLFSLSSWAPYLGLQYSYGLGTAERFQKIEGPDSKNDIHIKIDPVNRLGVMAGYDFFSASGYGLVAGLGYAVALNGNPVHFSDDDGPNVTEKDKELLRDFFASGIAAELRLVRAF